MSAPNTDEENVRLSVQGYYFIVKRTTIVSTDWILSKILTSEIPWEKSSDEGQIYLDIDPNSFRLILAVLNGTIDLSEDMKVLSRTDLVLLKATARYLMLGDLYQQIDTIESGIAEELRKKDEEISNMKGKVMVLDKIEKQIDRLDIRVLECVAYRTHCRYNRCRARSMVLGTLSPEAGQDNLCGSCSNDCSRLYNGREQMVVVDRCSQMEDLKHFVTMLEGLQL